MSVCIFTIAKSEASLSLVCQKDLFLSNLKLDLISILGVDYVNLIRSNVFKPKDDIEWTVKLV